MMSDKEMTIEEARRAVNERLDRLHGAIKDCDTPMSSSDKLWKLAQLKDKRDTLLVKINHYLYESTLDDRIDIHIEEECYEFVDVRNEIAKLLEDE